MTIILDTPAQINMWVLLSRRSQIKMQLEGIKTPGLLTWLKANIEGCENAHRVRSCIVPLEYTISQAGGNVDYSIVNLHMMEIVRPNEVFQDMGIYDSPDDIPADSYLGKMYAAGRMEAVLTLDEPRAANGNLMEPA